MFIQLYLTLWTAPARFLCPWDSPGKNTGVSSLGHSLQVDCSLNDPGWIGHSLPRAVSCLGWAPWCRIDSDLLYLWSIFSPGHNPDPETEPAFLVSPALAGKFFTTSTTWEAPKYEIQYFNSRQWKLCGRVIAIVCLPLAAKLIKMIVSSVQFTSVAQSCPTLCDPMNCSTPGLPVHHQLPEFTQTHVH